MYEIQEIILPSLFFFGALQGLILTGILSFTKHFKNRANRYLSLLVFTVSVLNIDGGFQLLRISQYYPIESYIPYFLVNLIPISIYFFTKYLTDRNYALSKKDYFLFLPFILDISYQIYSFIRYLSFGVFSTPELQTFNSVINFFELYGSVATLIVVCYSIKLLQEYEHKLQNNFSDIEQKSLNWVKSLFFISIPLNLCWMINIISDINPVFYLEGLAIVTWVGLTILIYWLSYSILMRPELLKETIFAVDDIPKSLNKDLMPPEEVKAILADLESTIHESKPYLNQDLNLSELANTIQTSDKKLSTVLNAHLETNFYEYINNHRIDAFKQQIDTGRLSDLSMTGLAYECGFKSKSSFYRAFKKHVGLTPSQYLEQSNA